MTEKSLKSLFRTGTFWPKGPDSGGPSLHLARTITFPPIDRRKGDEKLPKVSFSHAGSQSDEWGRLNHPL